MDQRQVKLVIGALLHDIGKVLYRYRDGRNHSTSGYEYLRDEAGLKEEKEILDQVRYHHAGAIKNANLPKDSLAYITYIADNISSAADRRKTDSEQTGFNKKIPLESIFNLLNGNNGHMHYDSGFLKREINYPTSENLLYDEYYYKTVYEQIKENLLGIEYTKEYLDSLMEVLESDLSYVPSSTNLSEAADISLFDHVKITAAVALCIEQWLDEQGISDYREELFKNAKAFYGKNVFLLLRMEFSGIQNFIYTITSKDALKMLRSRSFYLELMMQHVVDELLNACNLSSANVLYSGGGHAYLLLPNTKEIETKMKVFFAEVEEWVLRNFDISLYLGYGSCTCSAYDLENNKEYSGDLSKVYQAVAKEISQKKMSRYRAEQIIYLNKRQREHNDRECRVCHASSALDEDNLCRLCRSFIRMSGNILSKGEIFYLISKEPVSDESLFLPGDKCFSALSEHDIRLELQHFKENCIRCYVKNEPFTGFKIAKRLFVGDYTTKSSFEEFAAGSIGIKRIGVLRADVDFLGNAFVRGFVREGAENHYNTISRTATFSRKMSMFFKYHINDILEHGEYYLEKKENHDGRRLATIVYSGGDDIFIVGAWDEIIGFAVDLHQKFEKFTEGTLTFSAGIGIYPGKFPVSTMAREVGELEDHAKNYREEKDAVALFDQENVYSWSDFIERVLGEKLEYLKNMFDDLFCHEEKGNAFLYQMLDLIRNIQEKKQDVNKKSGALRKKQIAGDIEDGEQINIARFAYMLGRVREEYIKLSFQEEREERKRKIQGFSEKLYDWIQKEKDRKELTTAIYIYVYMKRKEPEQLEEEKS